MSYTIEFNEYLKYKILTDIDFKLLQLVDANNNRFSLWYILNQVRK